VSKRAEDVKAARSAVSAFEERALSFFDFLAATPLAARALVSVLAVLAALALVATLPASVDHYAWRDIVFYSAVVLSALLCGVAGGVAAVVAFLLFGHLGIVAVLLSRPVQPVVRPSAYFDFLFDSSAYIALARLPFLLARARRASEILLRAEAKQLRYFVEQAPAAMAMFDRDFHYLATSARWRGIFELDRDIAGKSHFEIAPGAPDEWRDMHHRALAGENVRAEQDRFVRVDGRHRWLRWEAQPWRVGDRHIGGVVIFVEDDTERVSIQRDLQENERRLTAIFETAMDAIVTFGRDGAIRSANPAAREIFGYGGDELIGRDVEALAPEFVALRHDSRAVELGGDGSTRIVGQRRVVKGRRKDGETFPLELALSEAGFDDDLLFVCIMRDLSPIEAERRRVNLLRAELAHVSRRNDMGEMVAGLAHEVAQPLAAIRNFAAAWRRALATAGKPPDTNLIGKIEEQARRASEILTRLRDFIEKRPPERRVVELATLIDDALKLVILRSHAKIVRAPVPAELAAACVRVDPIEIEQVLVNLLRNADDAVIDREAAEIVVEIGDAGPERVRIALADNGVGVPAEAAPRLFSPFFTTKHDGMGVGLSISKGVIESHGGTIAYRPNTPYGSIFEIELPLQFNDGGAENAIMEGAAPAS
jgi:two-component system sensor kinase FixL